MNRMNDDQGGWRPADMYSTYGGSQGSTYSSVSYGYASSADLSVPTLSSSNSLFRRRGAFSYAPASSGFSSQLSIAGTASYSQSPIAYNQGLHTTSSAEFRSFGGGGNAGAVSMSGGSIKSSGFSSTAPASVASISMPSTSVLAYNNTNADYLSSVSGDIAMASTQAYAGIGNTTGGMNPISGRKNGGMENSWLSWLNQYLNTEGGYGHSFGLTYDDLWNLYQEYYKMTQGSSWDPSTFDPNDPAYMEGFYAWLNWFCGGDGTHDFNGNTFYWVPVGDYMPLLVIALLYVLYIFVRHRKLQSNSENNI